MEQPKLFKYQVYTDHRGKFAPLQLSYTNSGELDKKWIQSNISISDKKNTIRGLHFQNGEYAQSKLIKVIQGEIIDFVVDLRYDSPNYKKIKFFYLSVDNGFELYVPKGFAHGFVTMTDNVILQYLVDAPYSPENEGCVNWKEYPQIEKEIKIFNKDFNDMDVIISDKDTKTYNLPPKPVEVSDVMSELIKKFPNDIDLGKHIRKEFNPF